MSVVGKAFKVLQCGCIEEDTKAVISGLAHQGGINDVLNQGPCPFIRAFVADAKAELDAEEKEKFLIKTCLLDAITEELQDEAIVKESMAEDKMVMRIMANFMDTGFYNINRHRRDPKRPVG